VSRLAVLRLVLPAALALLAIASAARAADPPSIGGSPLRIWAGQNGSVQVNVGDRRFPDGRLLNEFYPSGSLTPNAGFGVILTGDAGRNWGPFIYRELPEPTSGPTVQTGPTSKVTTSWTLTDSDDRSVLAVIQVLTYTSGQRSLDASYAVTNVSNHQLSARAFVGGELTPGGQLVSAGTARLALPPRYVGGVAAEDGATAVLIEDDPPWSSYQAGFAPDVQSALNSPTSGALTDEISPSAAFSGAAVEWKTDLPKHLTANFRVSWRFADTFFLSPRATTRQTGDDAAFLARLTDATGRPAAPGTKVVWRVFDDNGSDGPVTTTTGRGGRTSFRYVGGTRRRDRVMAFADRDANQSWDYGEPGRTATVAWDGPPAPEPGGYVVVRPLSGTARVKPPAARRFARLRSARRVPVESLVDASQGKVRLVTATWPPRSTAPPYQTGDFRGGRFKISQSAAGSWLPKLAMRGRRCRRKLVADAHGRFRTRGRHSYATASGSAWTMKDTCSTTTTIVTRGAVVVRDLVRRRTVVVTEGERYVARRRR
jgi:hypothetical protein